MTGFKSTRSVSNQLLVQFGRYLKQTYKKSPRARSNHDNDRIELQPKKLALIMSFIQRSNVH